MNSLNILLQKSQCEPDRKKFIHHILNIHTLTVWQFARIICDITVV